MLAKPKGRRGALLSGALGVPPGRVMVIGAGVAGANIAVIAAGLRSRPETAISGAVEQPIYAREAKSAHLRFHLAGG
jgi:alanine dehydrogenase